ncbi:MAG: DUF4342 domain-containing protein [Clostridiaceae bacterium]|nr:DUF4342 domain-containing protein [Clostridiaceae bacterium]
MITLEQVDQLRKRTNCSYEEAKALLEKHDGNVLEAIVDFEKSKRDRNYSNSNGWDGNYEWKKQSSEFWKNFKELIQKGFDNKVVIEDKNSVILNISVNIVLLFIIFIPYIIIPVVLLFLILGYNVSIRKTEGNTVDISSIVKDITNKFTGKTQQQYPQPPQTVNPEYEEKNSDYNEMTIE